MYYKSARNTKYMQQVFICSREQLVITILNQINQRIKKINKNKK